MHREAKCFPAAILRSAAALWVRRVSVSGRVIAVKAAMGAAEFPPAERHPAMTTHDSPLPFPDEPALGLDPGDPDTEHHAASPTAYLLDELALYGYRPGQDEPDPRPMPGDETVEGHLGTIAEALEALFAGTRLEDDADDLFWAFVNLFHRKAERIERELDTNEQAQRKSQLEQDGSEVKSVELERLTAQGVEPDRTAQRLRILPRSRRPPVRGRRPARCGARKSARWSTAAP